MRNNKNKFIRVLLAALLVCCLALTTGCTERPAEPAVTVPGTPKETAPAPTQPSQAEPSVDKPTEAEPTEEEPTEEEPTEEEPTEEVPPATEVHDPDVSLLSLRQALVGTPQVFAVAYFGYPEIIDPDTPAEPFVLMREHAYWLCEDLPFLLEIPQDRIVGETGELFCIVPQDENATVAVNRGIWDSNSEVCKYTDVIYRSESGDPILLFCNSGGWEPDTQVVITDTTGTETVWYPQIDDNKCAMPLRNDNQEDLFFDFSPYREILMAKHRSLEDTEWVMPTAEMLVGSVWQWSGYLKDGREVSYRLVFHEDVLSVFWDDGIDVQEHEYSYAPWELTYDEGFAVLTVDFGEFAGVLRYNLLYHEFFGELYVAMDVVQEGMPYGWEPLYRFLSQPIVPDPEEMVGTWELARTVVEGDWNEAEPGTCMLEITTDFSGAYWISYADSQFPDWNYSDRELTVSPLAIYSGCGNEQWSATVDYIGMYGTEYTLAVLDDGTLLMQYYWEQDGAPMVSYGYFQRS